ncbi:ABC transporter ATP-binding protein [soil metagenome]
MHRTTIQTEPGRATGRARADVVVATRGLTKRYGRQVVVDDVDLELPRGVVAGLIGPNGAGKTTVMAMLLGLVRPSDGGGEVLGHAITRPAAYLRRVGAVIEAPALYPRLTGVENLRLLAMLSEVSSTQVAAVLDDVGLADAGDQPFGTYSMGMRQRLGIAAALLGDPELLILDEPTNGLDPAGIRQVRALIAGLAHRDRTLLVSSHQLGELEQICDWLVVLDEGRVRYQGPIDDLEASTPAHVRVEPADPSHLDLLATTVEPRGDVEQHGHALLVTVSGDVRAAAAQVHRDVVAAGVDLVELTARRPNLEDRFLTATREES